MRLSHTISNPIRRAGAAAVPLLKATAQKFQRDRVVVLSAAMAYFALFSLFPLLLVVLSIIGMVAGRAAATWFQDFQDTLEEMRNAPADIEVSIYQQLFEFVDTAISSEVATLIDETLRQLYASSLEASIIGTLLLLWTASTIFSQMNQAFRLIWEVEEPEPQPRAIWQMVVSFVLTRLLAFGLVLFMALTLLVSLLLHTSIAVLRVVAPSVLDEHIWETASFMGAFGLLFLVLLLLFKFLPPTRPTWQDVWPGALLSATLITLLVNLSGMIIGSGGWQAYGLIGSVLTLLFWLFLSSMALYTGAIFTAVYTRMYGSQRTSARRDAPEQQ
jgi:membrane protein